MLLAIVCAAALLLAFQQVLQEVARLAETRSLEVAAQTDAVWRCNYSLGVGPRESCHLQRSASRFVDKTLNTADGAQPASLSNR